MEHNNVSNLSLAILGAEIFRFVIRTTDLKDPVEIGYLGSRSKFSIKELG